jgi:multimeric flavodoxin WrbA
MKILAINGSYRTNGNTARVLGLIKEHFTMKPSMQVRNLGFR